MENIQSEENRKTKKRFWIFFAKKAPATPFSAKKMHSFFVQVVYSELKNENLLSKTAGLF